MRRRKRREMGRLSLIVWNPLFLLLPRNTEAEVVPSPRRRPGLIVALLSGELKDRLFISFNY
jgi:hypothetical protein